MCFRPASMEAGKKCPQCESLNDQSAATCSVCGTELSAGVSFEPAVAMKPVAPAPPKPPSAPNPPAVPK